MSKSYILVVNNARGRYALVEPYSSYLGYWWSSIDRVFSRHTKHQKGGIPVNRVLENSDYKCYILPSRNIEDCKFKYPELFI